MYGLMEFIIWAILGWFADVSGAPVVSLSFGGKSKNDTGVVFAYRNGSWVTLGSGRVRSFKSASQPKKEERVNYTSELDDLFRRINLTLPEKMAPEGVKATGGNSEKPLGELFLEWLSKHEGSVKPVAAIKSTAIPVVGLQIDFDENTSARAMGRDFARVTSYSKVPSSAGELPFSFGHPSKKTQKSSDQRKSVIIKRHQSPAQMNLEPETARVIQKGPNSDEDLRSRFYVRKRRAENGVEEPIKFIIEPITISPLQLMGSDLIDLSSYFSDSESNMTKRHAIFSNPTRTVQKDSEPNAYPTRSEEIQHLRRQRSFTDIFTPAPAKASVQPAHKMPIFDDALPVESHVKKRHGKLFFSAKPQNEINPLTASPAAEESYSGQLMVRNEIPSDRKNKLNDLPKYVMKFLSQCKALIEQNYDEDSPKDNYDEDEALLRSNDIPNGKKEVSPRAAADHTVPGTRAAAKNTDIDEFESIRINKRPIKKKSKEDKGSATISIDNDDSRIDSWAPTGPSNINTAAAHLKVEAKNLLSAYDSDDIYDEDLDWHLSENHQPSEEKINRQMFFTSEVNTSTCRPIFADYAPASDNYTPACSEEPEVTTLNSEQWKVLMDLVNERLPCPTTCATSMRTRQSTRDSIRITMTPSPRVMKITLTNSDRPTSKNFPAPMTTQCTKQTTQTKCTTSKTTTTCATTTSTSATTTTTKTTSTPTTTCPTTTACTEETTKCADSHTVATTGEDTPSPKNVKQKNKPVLPQRYLIKIETSKPKHYNELSHLQGRSKPNNWFDNIKSLKLLEGLRSNNQNFAKPGHNVLNPKSASLGFQNDPESAEKMIAEGVIPLKTGSTLNLYISYVLNKTKAHKGKVPLHGNILDDKLSEAVPHKPLHDPEIHSDEPWQK